MYLFDKDILLEQKDEFNFEGIVAPHWSINGNPNGGYLTAFLAAAMQKKSDKKWPVIVTANFLAKCETEKKSTVMVEAVSTGYSLNRYQASLIQDGTERTRAWATFMDEVTATRVQDVMKRMHRICPRGKSVFHSLQYRSTPCMITWMFCWRRPVPDGSKAKKICRRFPNKRDG
jgi:acyl-CoA thioesterase